MLDAIYWDGDTAAANYSMKNISDYARRPSPRSARARAEQALDICVEGIWNNARAKAGSLSSTILRLSQLSSPRDTSLLASTGVFCAEILRATASVAQGKSNVTREVAALDSLLATGPPVMREIRHAGNLELARIYEKLGQAALALRAVRRRAYFNGDLAFLPTALREEGRLARLTGDRAGAIRAYQRYLALRSDPEPGLVNQTQEVRRELATLLHE